MHPLFQSILQAHGAPAPIDPRDPDPATPFLCVECEDAPPMRGFTVCKSCWDEVERNTPPWAPEMEEFRRGR